MDCCLSTNQIWEILLRILVIGSFLITRLHAKRERVFNSLNDVMEKINEYVNLAYDYWKYTGRCSVVRKIISARLKTEGFFLDAAVRSIPKVCNDKELLQNISELWEAATGGCFESDDEAEKVSMDKNIIAVARAAKELKSRLFKYMNC